MLRRDISMRIECAMPDRLIRRAAKEGVRIRRAVRIDPRAMICQCRRSDANALLEMCKLYHLNAQIIGDAQREPIWNRFRKRWTLLIGLALCAALMIAFLGRIWEIRIQIDGAAPDAAKLHQIRNQCEATGINIGTLIRNADTDLLQKNIAAHFPEIKYAGARLEGIRLCIDLRTETPAPGTFEIAAARDIVAARDGIIVSVEADSGHACVKTGDAVRAGQTLILGEEAATKEETAPVAASGQVLAKSWFEGVASGRTNAETRRRTGRESISTSLRIMDWRIPLIDGETYAQYETDRKITPIGGIFLPVALISETRFETETALEEIDNEVLQKKLAALARSEARSRITAAALRNAELIACWENTEIDAAGMHVHSVYEIISDIATTRDDLTKEVHATWKAMNK